MTEVARVKERYERRPNAEIAYDPLDPAVYMRVQERQRVLIKLLGLCTSQPLSHLRVLEVGCGTGNNLLELIQLGFSPENMAGCDLIEARASRARSRLPAVTPIANGDALEADYDAESFDIVYQSTVFSSILDSAFRDRLAARMWSWLKPGGAILWYDFAYNNPANPDVRGVPVREMTMLFPHASSVTIRRVTLAPPITRIVTKIHPSCYNLFNLCPLLRTHRLCWIQKQ